MDNTAVIGTLDMRRICIKIWFGIHFFYKIKNRLFKEYIHSWLKATISYEIVEIVEIVENETS